MSIRINLFIPIFCILFYSCSNRPLDIDPSGVDVEFKTYRLDKDFFNADFDHPEITHQELYQKYKGFYRLYLEEILKTGPVDDMESFLTAEDFVLDTYMNEAFEAIESVHDEKIEDYNSDFKSAFRHLKYHFRGMYIPDIIYYHSGFNYGIFSTDSVIGIGLEWFLGKEHKITGSLPFPRYRQKKMDPAFLVVNGVKDWCNRYLYEHIEGENLLETIVYYGKIMYMVDAAMPQVADSVKMNWTASDMSWAQENEFRVWKELASDQKTLYNKEPFEVNKWVTDGPFTSGLPQESPGMIGVWVGWMMLRDHHNRFPEKSLEEIINEDAAQILRSYNPKN